jgi:uncharacterized membrane protein YedE/YeeE
MPFTPVDSSVGGILIGISVAAYMYFNGRVTGISGTIFNFLEGAVKGKFVQDWFVRIAYIMGLVTGGILLKTVISPQSFVGFYSTSSENYTITLIQFSLAGLLVGAGTYLGSGCTSGHMICGVSRFSVRSITATMTFSVVALAIVKALGTAALASNLVYGNTSNLPFLEIPTFSRIFFYIGLLAIVLIIYFICFVVINSSTLDKQIFEIVLSFISGTVFGLGLGISGMTLPSKVLGFFDIGGPNWDPSLVFVALFAILPNMILYHTLFSELIVKQKPCAADEWQLPTKSTVDARLIIGAVLFGIGWGLGGICPGPGLVNIVNVRLEMIMFYVFYVLGLAAAVPIGKQLP